MHFQITDRQSDSQTDRQTDRQIDRQIDRQTNRQTNKQIGRQTDRLIDQLVGYNLVSCEYIRGCMIRPFKGHRKSYKYGPSFRSPTQEVPRDRKFTNRLGAISNYMQRDSQPARQSGRHID